MILQKSSADERQAQIVVTGYTPQISEMKHFKVRVSIASSVKVNSSPHDSGIIRVIPGVSFLQNILYSNSY